MQISIDHGQPEPLFVQVVGGIRSGIADGSIEDGERLPSARELADELGVNIHTVLRAFRRLADEGLVDMRPGRGTVVRSGVRADAEMSRLVAMLLNRARIVGVTREEVLDLVREKW